MRSSRFYREPPYRLHIPRCIIYLYAFIYICVFIFISYIHVIFLLALSAMAVIAPKKYQLLSRPQHDHNLTPTMCALPLANIKISAHTRFPPARSSFSTRRCRSDDVNSQIVETPVAPIVYYILLLLFSISLQCTHWSVPCPRLRQLRRRRWQHQRLQERLPGVWRVFLALQFCDSCLIVALSGARLEQQRLRRRCGGCVRAALAMRQSFARL